MWKDIKGYEGYYQISDKGQVRRLYYGTAARILKPSGRYPKVSLSKNGVRKSVAIHRLVAEHFCEKVYGTTEVNHIDGNPSNNNVSNLEWVTQRENIEHAVNVLGKPLFGKRARRVRAYDKKTGEFIKEYPSISEAARELSASVTTGRVGITSCCIHKKKSAYGYRWEYADIN